VYDPADLVFARDAAAAGSASLPQHFAPQIYRFGKFYHDAAASGTKLGAAVPGFLRFSDNHTFSAIVG